MYLYVIATTLLLVLYPDYITLCFSTVILIMVESADNIA